MRLLRSSLLLLTALVVSVGLFWIGGVRAALAHAKVLEATPGIGSTIAKAPTTVTVRVSQNLDPNPKNSNLVVYGPDGEVISDGDAKVPLNSPREMSVPIKPGEGGVYIVQWKTLSTEDGEADQGAFVFTVNPKAQATSTPATTAPSPVAGGNTSVTGGLPLWIPFVVGVLALLAGGGVGVGIGRGMQRRPSSVAALRQSVARQQEEEATKQP